jgi:molybdate transport system ATP-binding protein
MLEASIIGHVGSLRIEAHVDTRGGPLVLVGPNGAGKTTLLLLLLGIRKPDSGRVVVGDVTLFDSERRIDVVVEERRLGYVPQDYALFPHMTVLENVEFARASGAASDRTSVRAHSQRTLEDFGLSALASRQTTDLSGGEKQKVALARALAAKPRALLLDEPLAALDATARREVRAFLASYLARLDLPAVLVTHDPADAAAFGHRIAVLEDGRIVQTGTWDELRVSPASRFVEQFVS